MCNIGRKQAEADVLLDRLLEKEKNEDIVLLYILSDLEEDDEEKVYLF